MWYVKLAYEFHAIGFSCVEDQTAAQKSKLLREVIRHTKIFAVIGAPESISEFVCILGSRHLHLYKAIRPMLAMCVASRVMNIMSFPSRFFTFNVCENRQLVIRKTPGTKVTILMVTRQASANCSGLMGQDPSDQAEQHRCWLNTSFLTSQNLIYMCIVDTVSTRTGPNFTNAVIYVRGTYWTKGTTRQQGSLGRILQTPKMKLWYIAKTKTNRRYYSKYIHIAHTM